jgi:hypothetical protein
LNKRERVTNNSSTTLNKIKQTSIYQENNKEGIVKYSTTSTVATKIAKPSNQNNSKGNQFINSSVFDNSKDLSGNKRMKTPTERKMESEENLYPKIEDFLKNKRESLIKVSRVFIHKNFSSDIASIDYSNDLNSKILAVSLLQDVIKIHNELPNKISIDCAQMYLLWNNNIFNRFLEVSNEVQDILLNIFNFKNSKFCVVLMDNLPDVSLFLSDKSGDKKLFAVSFCGFSKDIPPCFTDFEIDNLKDLDHMKAVEKIFNWLNQKMLSTSINIIFDRIYFIEETEVTYQLVNNLKLNPIKDIDVWRKIKESKKKIIKLFVKS